MQTSAGSAGVSRDGVVVTWDDTDKLVDANCSTEHNYSGCSNDTTNNWTKITGDSDEQCVEKWDIVDPHIRCVRMKSSGKRTFLTTDTNPEDIDLGYRPFSVSAGWLI